jgi:hypothetical protein
VEDRASDAAAGAGTTSGLAADGVDNETNEVQDVFMEQQSYLYVTIELSEPLFPLPDASTFKQSGAELVSKYPEVQKFPSSRDSITEFEDSINFIVQQIGAEYNKMNIEEEKNTGSTTNLAKQPTQIALQKQ